MMNICEASKLRVWPMPFPSSGWQILVGALLTLFYFDSYAATMDGCAQSPVHCTDGGFSNSAEWSGRNTITEILFPQVENTATGGAHLYAEQGVGEDNTLYLMFDYTNPVITPSFFDVFFQVGIKDYLVRIGDAGISNVWVKPVYILSDILDNGSFNTGIPWELASENDLSLGLFQGMMGFGGSLHATDPHPTAEFQLSVNTMSVGENRNGLY